MRIATWNVNGLRARLELLLHWLDERRPDVVGLQELKVTDDDFPHTELEGSGYRAATLGQKGWNGVAILARDEVAVTQRGLPGQEELGARLLTAAVGGLSLTTVYCPNGKGVDHPDFPRKLAWFEALANHLEGTGAAGGAAVLCGDFNVCPTALDSWNEAELAGSLFHTEAERRAMRRLLDLGFRDLYREQHPTTRAFSWWDYRGGAFHRGMGLRIDLVLGTPGVVGRLRSAEVDRDYRKKRFELTPSDHAPVIVDLDA